MVFPAGFGTGKVLEAAFCECIVASDTSPVFPGDTSSLFSSLPTRAPFVPWEQQLFLTLLPWRDDVEVT